MILLQISSALGPAECALAVAHASAVLEAQARQQQVKIDLLETRAGPAPGTFESMVFALEGPNASSLADSWEGTVQWICISPYRPRHRRKNWFIGVTQFAVAPDLESSAVRIETLRASGPGGQHVNKTESAVRATHLATGLSVKVQTERSQHANKRLALALLAQKLLERQENHQIQAKAQLRLQHHQLQRGQAQRIYYGLKFELAP